MAAVITRPLLPASSETGFFIGVIVGPLEAVDVDVSVTALPLDVIVIVESLGCLALGWSGSGGLSFGCCGGLSFGCSFGC